MKCTRVQDLFSSYMEGAMDNPLRVAFEQHLAECAGCRVAYDRFHAAVVMLEEIPEVEPPADFHASVMARVQRARMTAPAPVKWWQIDWQHVFTIRVPARAAAMGLAVLLLMVMAVQLTPLSSVVGNLVGISRHSSERPIGVGGELVRPWQPWGVYSSGDSGLSIGVTPASGGAYDLRLETRSEEPVAFDIRTGARSYTGVVVKDQDAVVKTSVPTGLGSVAADLKWSYKDQGRAETVFLPAKFNARSAGKRLDISMENSSIRDVLRKVSESYGIVIIASGNLDKRMRYATVVNGDPREALFSCLEEAGMKSRALTNSVYAVEPLR